MYKRLTTIFLILVLLLSLLMLSSCFNKRKTYETEYFKYHIFEYDEEETIFIVGLTKKGEQLRNIVIPEEIDGKKVTDLSGHSTTPNLKKIIVSYNLFTINTPLGITKGSHFVNGYPDGLKVLYLNCKYVDSAHFGAGGYIATNAKDDYSNHQYMDFYKYANMQYMFNYEDAQNEGVFFIDDLDINEQLEIIPEIPNREGYKFTGWFAEPECINKIELQGYTKKDSEIVYLYAGWINE